MKPARGRAWVFVGFFFSAAALAASCTYSVGAVKPAAEAPLPNDAQATDAPPAKTYAELVLADRPLAYFRFDETSGTVAHDSSGHGIDGSYGKDVVLGAQGLLARDAGHAATFMGGQASTAS
jgi:hypothetical protein